MSKEATGGMAALAAGLPDKNVSHSMTMRTWSTALVCGLALIVLGLAPDASAQFGVGNGAGPDSVREALAVEAGPNGDLAETILSQREAEAGRRFDARYRRTLEASLAELPKDRLELLLGAGSGVNLREALAPNALGDSSADLVYTPVTPCRLFDTRNAADGILVGNTQRNFLVTGTTGFATQGGNVGGCGIPFGPATSVIINFAAVNPAGPGNLRAWAVANPQPASPLATVLNYSSVLHALANGIAVPICDPAVTSCATGDLRLQADGSSVHVVADVVGYFKSPGQRQTLKGTYGDFRIASEAGDLLYLATFSFVTPLAAAPAAPGVNFIPSGGPPTASCPGTAANPQAASGNLCVYEAFGSNRAFVCIVNTATGICDSSSAFGAAVGLRTAGAGSSFSYGSWAVTMP